MINLQINRIKVSNVILIFLLFIHLTTQIKSEIKESNFNNTIKIDGFEVTRNDIFLGQELFNYIDGAADIYFEYGFDKVYVYELIKDSITYKIEIFKMKEPGAFGIYSISDENCFTEYYDSNITCRDEFRTISFSNNFFFVITNEVGNETAQTTTRQIMNAILGNTESKQEKSFFIFDKTFSGLFGEENKKILKQSFKYLKFAKGSLGVQNGIPNWQKFFKGINRLELFYLPHQISEGVINIGVIKFNLNEDAEKFFKNLGLGMFNSEYNEFSIDNNYYRLISKIDNDSKAKGKFIILFESDKKINNFFDDKGFIKE